MSPAHEEFIRNAAALEQLCDHIRHAGRFALDTEFVSEETYQPVLCLIQVATADRLAVIDPLAVSDLRPFWELVTRGAGELVMHAAGEEIRLSMLHAGRPPARLIDVQIAAGLVGLDYPLSLGSLVQQVLQVRVRGAETRTDWRRRPLSEHQLRYALDDVRYLLPLWDRIARQLDDLGRRDWARGEFERQLQAADLALNRGRWQRIGGIHRLDARQLAVVRALAAWRDDQARASNRPPRQVVRDDLLVELAKQHPTTPAAVRRMRGLYSKIVQRSAEAVVGVIATAWNSPPDTWPHIQPPVKAPPQVEVLAQLLQVALAAGAAEHRVAPSLVASASDVRDWVHAWVENALDDDRLILARGWRRALFGDLFADLLEGRRTIRVANPRATAPLSFDPREEKEDEPPGGSSSLR